MKSFALLVVMSLLLSAQTQRGTDLGNAGDKVREVFSDARYIAVDIMSLYSEDADHAEVPDVVHNLLRDKRDDLKNDLIYSNHIWRSEAPKQGLCSETKNQGYEPIYFFYEHCRVMTNTDAVKELLRQTLIHASVSLNDAKQGAESVFRMVERRAPTLIRLINVKPAVATQKMMRLTVADIAGRYESINKNVPPLVITESGEVSWPLVSVYADQKINLSIGQFLQLKEGSQSFHVMGQLKYKAAADGGLSRQCSANVAVVITPSRDVTQMKITYIRPATLLGDCTSQGEITEDVVLERTK